MNSYHWKLLVVARGCYSSRRCWYSMVETYVVAVAVVDGDVAVVVVDGDDDVDVI